MDSVFKALADASRRDLLDALRREDGQTLSQLEAASPLSRFGVAKHLGVLEAAGLVTRVKRGRFTHHYLNAVPLAEALGRWIEPYRVAPAVRGVLDLKARLEGGMETKPDFVMSTFIRCTQDALWAALTEAEDMGKWHFLAAEVRRDGDVFDFDRAPGDTMLTCRTLETDPKTRLVTTFELHGDGVGAPSRVVYRIAPEGAHCRLTLEHYDLTFPVIPGEGVADGWERWAAGLKTWLETGEATRFREDALA
ncbi:MAG: SRPBCC domain-containing protein [Pseudomonadota bacterium]